MSNIINRELVDEIKESYLSYAMSVIVGRAIPDLRDGLKPVQRRVLYCMHEMGLHHNKAYKKSARVVGDVIGKLHPHGDTPVYESLVRMAQDFSLREPLIDGQGNFGSVDNDPAAAMRYTEVRMKHLSAELLRDIEKQVVDFRDNYDGSQQEPVVFPAAFPNILVNGASGIAVGMGTNTPAHNLGEVIDGCILLIDNPDATMEELRECIQGPDFPTGGTILGIAGINSYFATGRGTMILRGKVKIEEKDSRNVIVINEIPYQVNKAALVEKIADLVKSKSIEGISALRDESNMKGIRVVIEIRKGCEPELILNQLYKFTQLQISFSSNMLLLNKSKPELLNIPSVLRCFIEYRIEVVERRTRFLLNKDKAHIHNLVGMLIAHDNIDEVISIIRASQNTAEAKHALMKREWNATNILPILKLVSGDDNLIGEDKCKFTIHQVSAILEIKLQKLVAMERERLQSEIHDLHFGIKKHIEILSNTEKKHEMIREEFVVIKEKFATPRRTIIEHSEYDGDIEQLIKQEEVVVTITIKGYIKSVSLEMYNAQKRGGKGKSGQDIKNDDVVSDVFIVNTHDNLLFFSNKGTVYKLKVYKIPKCELGNRGRAIVNLLNINADDAISTVTTCCKEDLDKNMIFITKLGNIRRNDVSDFANVPSNGKIAMKLDEGDQLISVNIAESDKFIFLLTKFGKSIRFPIESLRVFKSRSSQGVRAIKLANEDEVVSMAILSSYDKCDSEIKDRYLSIPHRVRCNANEDLAKKHCDVVGIDCETFKVLASQEQFLLVVTEFGYGKRSSNYEYRVTARGGSGVIAISTSKRNGNVVDGFPVQNDDEIILITAKGKVIRTPVGSVRIAGRNTQGVTLFKVGQDDKVVSVAKV